MNNKNSIFSKFGLYIGLAALLMFSLIIQSCSTTTTRIVEKEELTSTTAPQVNTDELLPANEDTKVPGNQFLEKAFQKQKQAVENISKQIEKSDELREKTLTRITELKNQGSEVPILEDILKRFDDTITAIEARYQKIQENVSEHKGFDEAGKVIDAQLGWETVKGLTAEIRKIQQVFYKVRRNITLNIFWYKQFQKTPMPS